MVGKALAKQDMEPAGKKLPIRRGIRRLSTDERNGAAVASCHGASLKGSSLRAGWPESDWNRPVWSLSCLLKCRL